MNGPERAELLHRLAVDLHDVADRFPPLHADVVTETIGRPFTVTCSSAGHPDRTVDVATLWPEAPIPWGAATLEGNTPSGATLLDLMRNGDRLTALRYRYRLVCPVCRERGPSPELRAERHVPLLVKLLDLGVSHVDLSSLERYVSG